MIYRTLHTYILRELLRVFLLTASALTTLMAFGGMFKPLTKQGIDVSQVMVILLNLMPAMLAYAIPIAALFAAVLVYWRMSTDNELTACRAGGISFLTIVMPAFLLGLAVSSVDLLFVNYVVPRFLQSTERVVQRDLASLLVNQISHNERFEYRTFMVTADAAELLPREKPGWDHVVLHGFAATTSDQRGKPKFTAVGQRADLFIHKRPNEETIEVDINLANAMAFDPAKGFQKVSVSVQQLSPDGRPLVFPSIFRSKAKFLNYLDLMSISRNPYLFPSVAETVTSIKRMYDYERISAREFNRWNSARDHGPASLTFSQPAIGGGTNDITLFADKAALDDQAAPDQALTFSGNGPNDTIRIEERAAGKLVAAYTCQTADLVLTPDSYTGSGVMGAALSDRGSGVAASLRLHGNITRENHLQPSVQPVKMDAQTISGLSVQSLDAENAHPLKYVNWALASPRQDVHNLGVQYQKSETDLLKTITSELHSRGSFAISCLTLVLLGAALGILLHGQNPLAVFVVGFVPAIILILLITAGRQVTEGTSPNVVPGIILIWAGNVVLLAIVAAVYFKLLRR
jgi:lipopolysaccharide export LptBFGC system permease protein LptF